MKLNKILILILILSFSFLMLISPVYAETDVNLSEIHEQLALRLGVSTFIGGIICTTILFMMIVLPIAIIARRKTGGFIPELIGGMLCLSLSIALGWLPTWILLITILMIVALLSGNLRDWLGGRGGG